MSAAPCGRLMATTVFLDWHTVPYLARELHRVADSWLQLCSAFTSVLDVPSTRHVTIGDRAFGVAAARVWNTLAADVMLSSSLPVFRRQLKTFLFACLYT